MDKIFNDEYQYSEYIVYIRYSSGGDKIWHFKMKIKN